MKHFLTRLGATAVAVAMAGAAFAQDLPTVRAAVLKIGTVNWELATIV